MVQLGRLCCWAGDKRGMRQRNRRRSGEGAVRGRHIRVRYQQQRPCLGRAAVAALPRRRSPEAPTRLAGRRRGSDRGRPGPCPRWGRRRRRGPRPRTAARWQGRQATRRSGEAWLTTRRSTTGEGGTASWRRRGGGYASSSMGRQSERRCAPPSYTKTLQVVKMKPRSRAAKRASCIPCLKATATPASSHKAGLSWHPQGRGMPLLDWGWERFGLDDGVCVRPVRPGRPLHPPRTCRSLRPSSSTRVVSVVAVAAQKHAPGHWEEVGGELRGRWDLE